MRYLQTDAIVRRLVAPLCKADATNNERKALFTPNISIKAATTLAMTLVLIENSGVTPEWSCNPFSSDSIVLNVNTITSAIAELLHL